MRNIVFIGKQINRDRFSGDFKTVMDIQNGLFHRLKGIFIKETLGSDPHGYTYDFDVHLGFMDYGEILFVYKKSWSKKHPPKKVRMRIIQSENSDVAIY